MSNDLNGDLFHLIRKRKQKEMGKENQAASVKREETKSPSGRGLSLLARVQEIQHKTSEKENFIVFLRFQNSTNCWLSNNPVFDFDFSTL